MNPFSIYDINGKQIGMIFEVSMKRDFDSLTAKFEFQGYVSTNVNGGEINNLIQNGSLSKAETPKIKDKYSKKERRRIICIDYD